MPLVLKILFMHLFFGIFMFMLASSLLLVGYVWIRDIKHKKTQPIPANAGEELFDNVEPAKTTLAEYPDLRQKTA